MAADQKSMDDARKWNSELDGTLHAEGVVDETLYLRLLEAYRYDAASSVGWVEAKMGVLMNRVRQGKELSLFTATTREQTLIRNALELRSWIDENFSGLKAP